MEKIVEKKDKKNEAQMMEQKILNYLTKCSKHLFLDNNGYFYKVFLVKVKDKWYGVSLRFNGNDTKIKLFNISNYIKWYGNNSKKMLKNELFQYFDGRSIKKFKLMKEMMLEVNKFIINNYGKLSDSKFKEDLSKLLKGVEPKK